MKNYVLIFLFLFGFLDLFLYSCCPEPEYDYTKMISMQIANSEIVYEPTDSTAVDREDFRIKCTLGQDFVARHLPKTVFVNSAYAFKCTNVNGYKGLKADIVTFSVLCNEEIIGIPANTPIPHEKIRTYTNGYYDDSKNTRTTISKWLKILNEYNSHVTGEWFFEFQDTITNTNPLKFTFRMEMADSTFFQSETESVFLR
jgi:hypothetical protein